LALASARAAFLAAASASCSGVSVGLAPLGAFSFFSAFLSSSAICDDSFCLAIRYEVSKTVPHLMQTRRF
jgi:hypothetical protein